MQPPPPVDRVCEAPSNRGRRRRFETDALKICYTYLKIPQTRRLFSLPDFRAFRKISFILFKYKLLTFEKIKLLKFEKNKIIKI